MLRLAPRHLKRYKDISRLFLRYIKPALLERASRLSVEYNGVDPSHRDLPEKFAAELERLGPTFVKLGQLLSTRGDLLPLRYATALERLQDNVEPIPREDVLRAVRQELGARLSKAFAHFDESPMASASIGQVHRAQLRDGREVVVKVQRPEARAQISEDLEALSSITDFGERHLKLARQYRFSATIEQFRRSIVDELDYDLEAQNLVHLARSLKRFDRLTVPQPIVSYSSRRLLTMEFIRGIKITEIPDIARPELDGYALAETLFEAYLHQVLIEGFYHADPHPGNLLLTDDGRISLIDLGMVGRINERMRDGLFQLLSGITSGESETASEAAIKIAEYVDPRINRKAFLSEMSELVGRVQHAPIERLQFGTVVLDVMRIAATFGIRIPREISVLGKALLNLDRVGMTLSPAFNPNDSIRRNLNSLARKRLLKELASSGHFLSSLIEIKELIAAAPRRLNEFMETLAENKLRIDVDAIDERALIQGFQKIANRIAMGLVIAALIVGASYLMRIESPFTLFGYPGLPMILFLFATACGILMMINIIRHDD